MSSCASDDSQNDYDDGYWDADVLLSVSGSRRLSKTFLLGVLAAVSRKGAVTIKYREGYLERLKEEGY